MSPRQTWLGWLSLVAAAAVLGLGLSANGLKTPEPTALQQRVREPIVVVPLEAVDPATLLPADATIYVSLDGQAAHQEAWEGTAAYAALYESGMVAAVEKMFAGMFAASGRGDDPDVVVIAQALQTVGQHGLSLSITVPANQGIPLPRGTVVLHQAGSLEPEIAAAVKRAVPPRSGIKFTTEERSGRVVTSVKLPPQGPPVDVAWWVEGPHLVLAVGIGATNNALAVAEGTQKNITSTRLWKTYRTGKQPAEITYAAWLNMTGLLKAVGPIPVPHPPNGQQQVTVADLLEPFGLLGVKSVVTRGGIVGKATWNEMRVEMLPDRSGLLEIADAVPFSLAGLPPLPATQSSFGAFSIDGAATYATLRDAIYATMVKLGPEREVKQVEDGYLKLIDRIGFDPETDLFGAFGNLVCIYLDENQMGFIPGLVEIVAVEDAETLRNTLDTALERLENEFPEKDLSISRTMRSGQEIVTVEIAGAVVNPSFVVTDKWFAIATVPQSLETFLLRLDGKLPAWKPTGEVAAALKAVPKQVTGVTLSDPRVTWRQIGGLLPTGLAFARRAAAEAMGLQPPFDVPIAELPPTELILQPLFPNVGWSTVEADTLVSQSRTSLPTLGIGGPAGIGAAAVGVALLLPAVQQAREAARRSQSMNNLKQIGIALHNYHDVYNSFPRGTVDNAALEPEERLSWMYSILPYIEQAPLYQQMTPQQTWDGVANVRPASTQLNVFLNPSCPRTELENGAAPTHYVGMAGLGKAGPTLPVTSPKAGIFGYNRVTGFRDITDGSSNTIMVIDATSPAAPQTVGPWAQGGSSTIRPLTTKPYINGPDGIGSYHSGGCTIGFGDGSVRFVSEKVDPTVMEAMATIAGGEVVPEF